jgi:hypothetical protein
MRLPILPALAGLLLGTTVALAETPGPLDNKLAAARKYVQASDRYMHHSRLRRGMKGYGLSVFAGTKIVRFHAEILSVIDGRDPHRDMILARLSGPGADDLLSVSGIIAGMSGSPVFIRDPKDGRQRMIGAVAYGWFAQKRPICGIQPITQMLAISGVVDPEPEPQAAEQASGPAPAGRSLGLRAGQFYRLLAGYDRSDILDDAWALARSNRRPARDGQIQPLPIPLTAGTQDPGTTRRLARWLAPAGLLPVQASADGKAPPEGKKPAELAPGSAISVHLVTGDVNWSAVGTVTDVIDKKVLAFGHSFMGEGQSSFPIGPAYVHTIIASDRSFKLSSPAGTTGATRRDEHTGVLALLGESVEMIPMTLELDHKPAGRRQTFRYQVARDRRYLPLLMRILVDESVLAWSNPPPEHHVRYQIEANYPRLGRIEIENVFSDAGPGPAASDLGLLLFSLADNPVAQPRFPESVTVRVTVEHGSLAGQLEHVQLDGTVYRPGQTLTGTATFRRFREERFTQRFTFVLPEQIEPGEHTLQVGDFRLYLQQLNQAQPLAFEPRTAEDIFQLVKTITRPRADRLYLALPGKTPGITVDRDNLENLPPSRLQILQQARLPETQTTRPFTSSRVEMPFDIHGRGQVQFTVRQEPRQSLLHAERNAP